MEATNKTTFQKTSHFNSRSIECSTSKPRHTDILSMPVAATTRLSALERILTMAKYKVGKYVCVSNVHMCMEAYDSREFNRIIRNANLIVPDGRPLVWSIKALGYKNVEQVRGVDLMLRLCEKSQDENLSIGLYGGSKDTLEKLVTFLKDRYPKIDITYSTSPPYRTLTEGENDAYVEEINASNVDLLFVGIGCPKQEIWMEKNRSKLTCTMLGVGAAFDFLSGDKKQAPVWMQKGGLEWLYRFASDPQRLWKRYLKNNPRFVLYFAHQLIHQKCITKIVEFFSPQPQGLTDP